MAFVEQTDPNNPNLTAPQQGQVSTGGQGVGGASKAANTPGQNVPAAPSAQLSAYLGANQPQSAAFAGQVANNLSGQVSSAQNAIQPAVNTYTGNLYSVPTDAAANQAVSTSPSSLTPDQQASYKAELGAASKAPNPTGTFETTQPYQDLTSNIQKTVEQANLWRSGNNVPAISAALAPFEPQGQTSGNTTLDALLLSQTPGAYKQITDAVAPADQLQGQLGAGASQANMALQNAVAADTAATQGANQAASQYVSGLNKNLAGYLSQAQNSADAYNTSVNNLSGQAATVQPDVAKLQDAISAYNSLIGGNILDAPGESFGLRPINLGMAGAVPGTIASPTAAQVATPQQYADLASLEGWLGKGALGALGPSVMPESASQAGTYAQPGPTASLQSILDPLLANVPNELRDNSNAIGANQNLQGVQPLTGAYNAVADALAKLSSAEGVISPIGDLVPSGGGGSIVTNPNPGTTVTVPASNPAPILGAAPPPATWPTNPNGTYGTVPATTTPPTPPVGFGAAQAADGSWSLYLLPPSGGRMGLT